MVSAPARSAALMPFGAMGMHGNLHAEHMCLGNERIHFGLAILLAAHRIGLGKHPAGAAEFDDLGTALAQLSDLLPDCIGTIGYAGRINLDVRREFGGIAMAAGGPHRIGCRHDARPGDIAALDRLFQRRHHHSLPRRHCAPW